MKQKLLLLILGVLSALPSLARDFTYTYEGQTITYTVIDEQAKTCMTKAGYGWKPGNEISDYYLRLPPHPKDGDIIYTLIAIGDDAFFRCGQYAVDIPESVTSIGEYAFYGCECLRSIVIPNSVKEIGRGAFGGCIELASVVISNSVTEIGDWTFDNCISLTSVVIPNSVMSIGHYAFCNCDNLISVDMPNSVTSIGCSAFSECYNLISVEIPNSVTDIGDSAFYGCSVLTSVEIPNSVTKIGLLAFDSTGLRSLTFNADNCTFYWGLDYPIFPNTIEKLVIGDKVTRIPADICHGLDKLTSVEIPNSVISIGEYAFYGCSSLTSVEIPNSVTSIGRHAFSGCSRLTSVAIPSSVTQIGASAFYGCSGLTSVDLPSFVTSIGRDTFSGCSGLISVEIPSSVTQIGESAFYGCSGLRSVAIPSSVIQIGESAFYGCSGLKSVAIPSSVTQIGESAFYGCSGLSSVNMPSSLTQIGSSAFSGCRGITSIVIPNSVSSIGDKAFDRCSGLRKSAYPETIENPFVDSNGNNYGIVIPYNPENAIIEDGWIWGPEKNEIRFVPYNIKGNYSIPETVTSIGSYAFYDCSGLTAVNIPSSVKKIGSYAFVGCSGLTSVNIPSSVRQILSYTFDGCSGLISVEIPSSVTSIGRYAFDGCSGLVSMEIPNSVTQIGEFAFYGCSSLTSVKIPSSVELIRSSTFYGCSSLTSLVIPSSVTSIGSSAFFGCIDLKSVVIPNSVTYIGAKAFYGCSGITSLVALPSVPAVINEDTFDGLYDKVLLSVPDETINEYLASNWSLFKNIQNNSGSEIKTFSDGFLEYRLNPTDMTAMVIGATNYSELQFPERFTDDSDPSNLVRYYIKGIGYKAFDGKDVHSVEFKQKCQIELIGDYAFANTKFSSITLPETVSYIGMSAFRNSELTSIEIPEGVIEISDHAFYNCTSLTDVKLNSALSSIGASAFSMDNDRYDRDKTFGSLTIPTSLKHIGKNAFRDRILSKVIISDLKSWCNIDFSNNDSNPCGWAVDGFWLGENEVVDLVIPEGITEVKPFSFVTCGKLHTVKLPQSVISIGEDAFYGNYYISSVAFPDNLERIGDRAFMECRISSVSIPPSVQFIGHQAFISWGYPDRTAESFTKYLDTFILEDGLAPIEIEYDAFSIPTEYTKDSQVRYNAPTDFYMGRPVKRIPEGFNKTLANLTVGNYVDNIADGVFAGCSEIRNLNLGSAIKSIGDEAFSGCTALTEVVLPPYLETIGASAFAGNSSLEKINIGHSIRSVGDKAFDGCKASVVNITAQTPPTAPNNSFSNYNGKLYLQGQSSTDTYYDAYTCWDRFDSYVMIDAEEMSIDGSNMIVGNPGNTFQLKATLLPENVTLPYIFWRSTNPKIATVDNNGLVTLLDDSADNLTDADGDNDGACKIIAESLYYNGPIAEVTVNKSSIAVPYISINESKLDLKVGQSSKLTVTAENLGDKSVTWKSSKESVAVVNENGEVTVVGVGKAAITASCGDLSSECSLKCYPVPGDANWSGDITITDAVDISNYVVKKKVAPEDWNKDEWISFYAVGANANESEDGNITFADASAAVRLALAQPVAASDQKRIAAANKVADNVSDALVVRSFTETNESRISASVNLDNSIEYVALQADVIVPDGMDIEVKAGPRSADTHSLETFKLDNNRFRLALFNIGNKAFVDNDEVLLEITADSNLLSTTGLTIENVIASDADAKEYVLGTRTDVATGVAATDGKSIRIQKVSDSIHISNAIGKTVEIYTSEGQKVKSFVADEALEVINLSTGLYIVKAGDKTLKVIM